MEEMDYFAGLMRRDSKSATYSTLLKIAIHVPSYPPITFTVAGSLQCGFREKADRAFPHFHSEQTQVLCFFFNLCCCIFSI